MVAIPNQTISIRNPGLAQTPEAIETFIYLGTCSAGEANVVHSFNTLTSASDTLGQGPLSEDVCRHAALAGGPVLAMRLIPDVAGDINAVTKLPVGSSTGTLAITVTPQAITKAWAIDIGGPPVYTDETTDINDADAADVNLYPATEVAGDQFAIGFTSPFAALNFTLSTLGTVGTTTWKYWNGTAWTALTGVAGAAEDFLAAGAVTWTMPTDWARTSINGSAELYYVVAEVATEYTINPVATSATITDYGPHDTYDVSVKIETTGTLGAGEFSYLLDGSDEDSNRSPVITIPSGGIYDIPDTGLRATFTPGAGPTFFEAGDEHTFTTVAPHYSTTALSKAIAVLRAGTDEFAAIVLSGRPDGAAAGATMFAAFNTHLITLATEHRYCGGIMDTGAQDTAATTKTEFAAVSTDRVMPCFDVEQVTSMKPITGWVAPWVSVLHVVAPRAGESLISTHLGRFADGPLEGVLDIGYNEEKDTDAMSAAGFCTLRTWQGFPGGFYINRPNIKTAAGSDYDMWQYRRIADVACDTTHKSLQRFMNTKVRVLRDGSGFIDPKEALRIEGEINAALATNLTEPLDAEGNRGHVAAVAYRVNLAHNVAGTNRVEGSVVMVRDGYAEEILTTIGFAASAA